MATVKDDKGVLGVLSIQTTEGILDIALDREAADAIMTAISSIKTELGPES
ncbi:hypothetical protein [Mesorhizobium sp. 131-2-5]|uniref:hypothetical protein n=1 Tax=Mesorhizobium sp. 131-2-5 TaxID=2744519 RepID=UPI001FD3C313|nr:hypothetical protein [Mesorhizobium sp. 131-2-5]